MQTRANNRLRIERRPRPALDDPMTAHAPPTVLANGDVRFVGDPIVLIIAESRYIAEDAAELVIVDIDAQEPLVNLDDAVAKPDFRVHPENPRNEGPHVAPTEGIAIGNIEGPIGGAGFSQHPKHRFRQK